MADDKESKRLRKTLETALRKEKLDAAVKACLELELLEPKSSRWPHRRGDLLRRMGQTANAVGAYDRAVACYTAEGFVARAVAMAKTVLVLDPLRIDVLARVDPAAARAFVDAGKPSDKETSGGHSAILPEDDDSPAASTHSAVVPESEPPPPIPMPAPPAESEPPPPIPMPIPRAPRAPVITHSGISARTERALATLGRRGPPPLPVRSTSIRPAPPLPPRRKPTALDEAVSFADVAELVRAPDAALNEIRFSDLPPKPPSVPPLTFADMVPRPTLPPTATEQVRATTPRDLSLMPLFPLFSELPTEAFVELVTASSLVELPHGHHVIRRGDPSDCLYGIVEGSVQMQPPGMPPEMFTGLSEGDVFGESCLLREEPRHDDVVVQGHLTALRMPKVSLDALVRKHRRVAEVLLELLTRRLIGNFLNGSHLFSDVDPQTRTDIANLFEVRRAPVDTAVMEAGKRSDGVYIALTGRVLCKLPGIDEPIEAGAGSMFGHASLLGEAPSEVGVRTMANMILLRLPAARFTRIAMQYPTLLERITELPPLADVSL